jgi:hypothetical protein
VKFYINDVLVATFTTDIPTAATVLYAVYSWTKAAHTTNSTTEIDRTAIELFHVGGQY